ncbi:hypothetical protein EIP91_006408 [Steccherinum ochraceum]|uniref:Uncharacterized protein n=1 Tax=Steccherinum ochraceum TaxID=92696 RepID=A0A4R0R5N8_9APHY|nr:hypothetical protein EIP91_006408 [Steccherinum ochraceum]
MFKHLTGSRDRTNAGSIRSVTPPPRYEDDLVSKSDSTVAESSNSHRPSRTIPPAASPVVMTWQPAPEEVREIETTPAVYFAPVIYLFKHTGPNSLLVTPPSSALDANRPLYHVSWYDDFLNIGNKITTIRRGGTSEGSYVGMFDLKGGKLRGVVRLGSRTRFLSDVITNIARWQFDPNSSNSPRFFWDHRQLKCSAGSGQGQLAKFIHVDDQVVHVEDFADGIEVQPAGQRQEMLDELILSLLIVMRQKIITTLLDTGSYA